jgi:uncharacterized protein (DUF58 family)
MVAAAASVAALGSGPGLFLAATVAAVTVIDGWLIRRPPGVEGVVPEILARGHAAPFRIGMATPGRRPTVRLPHPATLALTPDESPDGLDGAIVARLRGRYALGPAVVRSRGPLGLATWDHTVGEPYSVIVYPDVINARRLSRAVATGRFTEQGLRRVPRVGLGTEFESIRDYSPDDDIRQVNWRATQRLSRPMSNEYRIDQDRDVICMIDTGRLMASPLGEMTRLDAAIDAATAVAYTADELGDRVGVLAFDARVRRTLAPHRRGASAFVRSIYDLEPTESESDYDAAFRAAGRSKRALVVVFTDLLEESAALPLLEAMPVLTRRHEVIVATSSDREVARAISESPREPFDVFRAAAALDLLEAKDRVAARLRRAGAHPVEGPAGLLPEVVVGAYLDLKRRARA